MSETNFKKQSRNIKQKHLSNNHKTEWKNQSDITCIKEDNRTNKPVSSCPDSNSDRRNTPAYEVNNSLNYKRSYLTTSNHIRKQNTDHKNSDIKSARIFKNSNYNSNKNESDSKKYRTNNEHHHISVENSFTVRNSNCRLVTSESNSGNVATGSTTSADCDKDNKDNLKMSWKMKRLKEKEEKRIRREESIRRERIAPKSEHFKVINSMTFEDFINSDNTKNKTFRNQDGSDRRTNNEFKLTQSLCLEFPDLNSTSNYSNTKNRNKFNNHFKSVIQNSSDIRNYDSSEVAVSSETIISINNDLVIPKSSAPNGETSRQIKCVVQKVSNAKKKVRKTDLIEFNIGNVLEMIQEKQKNNTKLVNTSVISKKKHLSKRSSLLVGNKLDADNPVRKRGKYRENKKRKLTRMKRLIVNERQIRMFLRNEAKEFLEKNQRLDIDHSFETNVISHVNKTINYDKPKLNEQNLSENNCTIASLSIDDNNETKENGADHEKNNNSVPKMLIHSRKFRYYCNQWPNKEMSNYVNELIKSIVRFQDRHHDNDPIKARAKRRYVCGFHEVFKFTQINKPKLIIIATDMECVQGEGGLLDYISQLTTLAEKFNIPYVFSGTRWSLKSSFRKKCPISVAAILNYDGAEDLYKNVIRMLPEVKCLYLENLKAAEKKCGINHQQETPTELQEEEDVTSACIQSLLNKLTFDDDDKVHHKKTSTEDSSDDFDDDHKFSSNINSVNDNNCPFMSAILKFS